MTRYEYKVVPAPTKGLKGKGVKGPEARFCHALQELMNGLSGYGWEFMRAETLPSVERSGLTGSSTEWRNVLVFRRLRENASEAFNPELLPPPGEDDPVEVTSDGAVVTTETGADTDASSEAQAETEESGADNGVEDTRNISRISGALSTLALKRKSKKTED